MFRGTTARTVITLFTVALLGLQFFTSSGTFASAHTLSHAKAKAVSGTVPSPKPVRNGTDTLRDSGCSPQPLGTQHIRDRQRGCPFGWAPERPPISRQAAAVQTPAASGAPHHRTTRSSRAHSAAALQVFRC
ncbi:hypothetical protein J2Z21_001068 [Streptomyces griseochromogenes]|uniref:Secreted protein n=1 Tax=Streptomyces griseochromogenes TaxID=68214 RepID=A0ABS4LL78_9ACTN|nr:hypothetical protein [Streptomyces griseochromogenes]